MIVGVSADQRQNGVRVGSKILTDRDGVLHRLVGQFRRLWDTDTVQDQPNPSHLLWELKVRFADDPPGALGPIYVQIVPLDEDIFGVGGQGDRIWHCSG
jgi:hypothetical protein